MCPFQSGLANFRAQKHLIVALIKAYSIAELELR